MNDLRGQFPDSNVKTSAPKALEVFGYLFRHLDLEKDGEVLKERLWRVCEKYSEKKQEILKILKAVEEVNEKALNVSEKRQKIRDSFNDQEIQIVQEDCMRPLHPGHFALLIMSTIVWSRSTSVTSHRTPSSSSPSSGTSRNSVTPTDCPLATPTRPSSHSPSDCKSLVEMLRTFADVVKLENGSELLVMIPESMQTSLQLHYMDTRTNLLQGMFSLRTEQEPIPFTARHLYVTGNCVVLCGTYQIYALRFFPQGTVIDRAHIKLPGAESNSSLNNNPVLKAKFCTDRNNKKQLIALATVQYLQIYDLTLSDTNFIEELVLTAGNVADFVVLPQDNNEICVLIVSSSGFLYEHIISDCTTDNNLINSIERVPNTGNKKERFLRSMFGATCKFLDEFSAVISSNSVCLIFSLDHENLLEWLNDIGVRDEPKVTNKLVKRGRAIEEWDALMLLQLENAECDSEDVRTFSRFWMTDSMTAISPADQKFIEEEIVEMLKVPFEAQDALATATRQKRSKGNFPNRP